LHQEPISPSQPQLTGGSDLFIEQQFQSMRQLMEQFQQSITHQLKQAAHQQDVNHEALVQHFQQVQTEQSLFQQELKQEIQSLASTMETCNGKLRLAAQDFGAEYPQARDRGRNDDSETLGFYRASTDPADLPELEEEENDFQQHLVLDQDSPPWNSEERINLSSGNVMSFVDDILIFNRDSLPKMTRFVSSADKANNVQTILEYLQAQGFIVPVSDPEALPPDIGSHPAPGAAHYDFDGVEYHGSGYIVSSYADLHKG
jgi:hypothetical protein